MNVSIVIPAHNEEETIGNVVKSVKGLCDAVIVVDDASEDNTAQVAQEAGAQVITQQENKGYCSSIERGITEARSNYILTMDADGEHAPEDIERFLATANKTNADLIIGKRKQIPREMERVISYYFEEIYGIGDITCGMRLIKKDIIPKIVPFSKDNNYGMSFVQDCLHKQMKVVNMPLTETKRREDARVGNAEYIRQKLLRIFIHLLENERTD